MTKKFSVPPKTNILAEGIHPDTWERLCLTAVLQQKPKLLVMDCNSDVVLQLSANSLTKWGHSIHVLDPEQPVCDGIYNPLGVASEAEIFRMARELAMDAATPLSFTRAVSFSLLQAIMLYLIRYRSKEEQTLTMVLRLLMAEITETLRYEPTKLDRLFDGVRELNWDDACVEHYDVFRSLDNRDRESIAALLYTHLSELTTASIQSFTGSGKETAKDALNQRNFLEHCSSNAAFFLSHFHAPETVPLRAIICRQILYTLAYGTCNGTFYPGMIMLSGKLTELVDKNMLAALNRRGICVMLDLPHGSSRKDELGVMCHLLTETPALFRKGMIMLDQSALQSPAPDKLSNWNDCVPDDPKKVYHPHLVERDDVKRLEEVRKKMEEKQKENIEKLSAGFERKRRDDRMLSARPIPSSNHLTRENVERPYGKPKDGQKGTPEMPATVKNDKDVIKELDATIIHEEKPTKFQEVAHERTGRLSRVPFLSRPLSSLNLMPAQEDTKDASPVTKSDEEKL